MTMRNYTGTTDGVAKAKRPGTEKFIDICGNKWGLTNLGSFGVRLMRSAPAGLSIEDPAARKYLSVHATGRACDLGYADRKVGLEAWDFFLANADALEIEEIHDYAFTGPTGTWGRGYRCNRGVDKNKKPNPQVKIYTATDNAGTPGGKWLHVELSPAMADDPQRLVRAWKQITGAK